MDLDDAPKPFIWRKKYEELGIKIDEKQMELESRRQIEENKIELQKIRDRQRQREIEYQQKLSDGEFLSRQKEAERHEHFERQESDFALKQDRLRSKIRIRDGRAKPIDLLAYYIEVFGSRQGASDMTGLRDEQIDLSDSLVELHNPCDWFNGLRRADLEELEKNITSYMDADYEENQRYWTDLLEITKNELSKIRAALIQAEAKSSSCGDINSAVLTDVMSLFEGKSISELDDLEDEMDEILKNNDPSIDVTFYENAISRLRAYRARMRLTTNHRKNLNRQKSKILDNKKDVASEMEVDQPKLLPTDPPGAGGSTNDPSATSGDEQMRDEEDDEDLDEEASAHDEKHGEAMSECIKAYKEGGYSPKMLRKSQLEPGVICTDYEKEYELLTHKRNKVCNANSLDEARRATMTSEERAFLDAASKDMNNQEESTFSCETALKARTYVWADKYLPRKPRYFNRVHTGFEWNKYNQTHYDIDNPPPKVVQGYKFNIFYPDLIDKTKAPTFTLTPCPDDKDFCTIRFSAGPPYEDIAFRIVSREWNSSHKSGYRCQFINNILQLWFQFKRYRYRR